jgi:WXXGXW repeat (2 copies)
MDNKSRRLTPARAAIAGLALAAIPMASFAFVSVGISITVAPPALPVYVQPPCPAVGYIWTPGYWAYGDDDYYWVPGTWVLAPTPGFLWTPGYWGWGNGIYAWHEGYWGPHVGFYGGVNYGYGYGGVGFEGGYWRGGAFYYNRSVANLGGVHVTNVYNKTVVNNVNVTRVSYNGGEGGLRSRPTSHELAAEHDHHVAFTPMQRNQEHAAFTNHDLRASVNQGKPRIAATQRPGVFTGHGVEAARAGEWHGGPAGARGAEGHVANDRGAPGRGPDVHAADRGGPGHGGPNVASRNDRPPGASGSAEVRGGTGGGHAGPSGGGQNRGPTAGGEPGAHMAAGRPQGPAGGADARGGPGAGGRNDRPAGNVATNHGPATGGEPAAHVAGRPSPAAGGHESNSFAAGRNDRPPGAGSPEVRGGAGGGQQPHVAVARTERPAQPNAGGSAMNRAPQQQREAHTMAPPARPAPQPPQQHFNGGGAPQPRPQMAPRQEAPRPQSAPRPEAQRGGGEPRSQGGGGRPQPQGRGPGEHGGR